MEIIELTDVPEYLFETFTTTPVGGKSLFSQLATSQTGNDRIVTRARLDYIKQSPDHIMLVCVEGEGLLGMTLAQRVTGINNSYIYIHDVVIDAHARGCGIGTKLITTLIDSAQKRWPEAVRVQLTSRPSRGTGPFFDKLGFRPRTEESGDPTVVYVKDVGDYVS